MNISEKQLIGELVAADYRAAEVFAKYRIDFCCNGGQTIDAACTRKKIDVTRVLSDLNESLRQKGQVNIDFRDWPLDLLIDYIEKKHHRYVESKTPVILQYLTKVYKVHGAAHPELENILALFTEGAQQLAAHMKKEELVLFPYIRKLCSGQAGQPHFGTVSNPIHMMESEHDTEGNRFRTISELSNNYQPPADACNTYRVAFSMLQEFEEDLHRHIHLENNILFPAAIRMEEQLRSRN